MNVTSINSFYVKVIMYGVTPVLLSGLAAFVWIVIRCTSKRKQSQFQTGKYIKITCYAIILLLLPTVTTSTFSLFSCVSYEDGHSYLRRDMSIQCWTADHVKMGLLVGLPLLAVWTFGFPLMIYLLMWKQRGRFDEVENLQLYGLFYVGITDQRFYWEIVIVNLRKLLIIALGTFITQS